MYLTRIDLTLQQRGIQRALGDCQQLHQMIMGLFESDRKSAGVLYRIREDRYATAIYLYSVRPINRERLLPGRMAERIAGGGFYVHGKSAVPGWKGKGSRTGFSC